MGVGGDLAAPDVAAVLGMSPRALADLAEATSMPRDALYDLDAIQMLAVARLLPALGIPPKVATHLAPVAEPAPLEPADHALVAALRSVLRLLSASTTVDVMVRRVAAHHVIRTTARDGSNATVATTVGRLRAFARHHEMTVCGRPMVTRSATSDELVVEVRLPVEELVGSSGDIAPGFVSAHLAAVARHDGDPLSSSATHLAVWEWIRLHGQQPIDSPGELFLSDDGVRLEVAWPIA